MSGKLETNTLSLSLRMARAYRFAQHKRWREAEQELSPAGGIPPENLALHALAAIVTQSGDNARALFLWKQFLQREPMHEEAMLMVDSIALWQSRPSWYRYLPVAAGLAAAVILLPLLLWAFSPSTPIRPASSLERPPIASTQASPIRQSPLPIPSRTQPLAKPAASEDSSPGIIFKPKPSKR